MPLFPGLAAVLFFDVNETLLDPAPLHRNIDTLLQKPGSAQLWFSMLLHYSLVMNAGEQYAAFSEIGAATLKMLALDSGLTVDDKTIENTLAVMSKLPPHADVQPGLALLRQKGYRLAALTNSSDGAASAQLEHAGLGSYFEKQLSVESLNTYKPQSDVYRWAAAEMQADMAQCMLIAAHGWDVAGAKWAGMQAAFIARPGRQLFPLAPAPDLTAADIHLLAQQLCS